MQLQSRRSGTEIELPLVYVSVLNWNGYQETEACLASLLAMNYPNYKIVVVDNGSTDGSVTHLEKWATEYPDQVTLLANKHNAGFTGGHNLAINFALAAGADYVWLVNNDSTVQPAVLTALITAASAATDIGLLSPVVYCTTQPDQILNCGGILHADGANTSMITDIATARNLLATDARNFIVFGAAMLIRRSLIDRIGLLDDEFFAYYEDIDYAIRSIDAGFRNIVVEEAVVYHDKSLVSEDDFAKPYWNYYEVRNTFIFMRKYSEKFRGLKGKLWYTATVLRQLERLDRGPAVKEAYLTALWDMWRGTTGCFDPRRRMPRPLRAMFGSWPGFWRRLLEAI